MTDNQQPTAVRTKAFRFNIGDVVCAARDDTSFLTPLFPNKQYKENLTVVFRFYDGNLVYILDTGDGDVCVIATEEDLKLQQAATSVDVPPQTDIPSESDEPQKTADKYYLGYVYMVNKRMVAANSIEDAIAVFRSHPNHLCDTIEKITLQAHDPALIQYKPEEQ